MDINFANSVFPRRCFIAGIFFLFFDQTWLVVISVKNIYPTFTNFFIFQFIPLKKEEGLNFPSYSKIEENNLFSPLSFCFVLFVWLVVFVFTTKTKTRQLISILTA